MSTFDGPVSPRRLLHVSATDDGPDARPEHRFPLRPGKVGSGTRSVHLLICPYINPFFIFFLFFVAQIVHSRQKGRGGSVDGDAQRFWQQGGVVGRAVRYAS